MSHTLLSSILALKRLARTSVQVCVRLIHANHMPIAVGFPLKLHSLFRTLESKWRRRRIGWLNLCQPMLILPTPHSDHSTIL